MASWKTIVRVHATRYIMEAILVIVCVGLAFAAPTFLSKENLLSILRSISMQGLIAFGMTMVIISGEIDLSVGSAAAFAGCFTAVMAKHGIPTPLAMLMAVGIGFGLGSFTGLMRTRFQVPSFITTLALFTGLKGASLLITKGFSVSSFPDWYSFIGSGYIAGIPVSAIIFAVGFVAVHVLMNYTSFGRAVYAVGGNDSAARLCGINVTKTRILVLAITGAFAAVSGIILSSRLQAGSPTAADGWELQVIAAVIIGGTSFLGGVGTIWGTLIGVAFIGVITNGMTLLNVDSFLQFVVQGLLILVAVLLNRFQERRTATA